MDGGGAMKVTTLKGLVHAGLAIAALAETKNAKSNVEHYCLVQQQVGTCKQPSIIGLLKRIR